VQGSVVAIQNYGFMKTSTLLLLNSASVFARWSFFCSLICHWLFDKNVSQPVILLLCSDPAYDQHGSSIAWAKILSPCWQPSWFMTLSLTNSNMKGSTFCLSSSKLEVIYGIVSVVGHLQQWLAYQQILVVLAASTAENSLQVTTKLFFFLCKSDKHIPKKLGQISCPTN
jgi:hypothetical protein